MSTTPTPPATGSHTHHRDDAALYRGQTLTGVGAILLGALAAVIVLTGVHLDAAQWMLILGSLSVALGVVGLLVPSRDRNTRTAAR